MYALMVCLWAFVGAALGVSTVQHPPGFVAAPVVNLDHVPKKATFQPAPDGQRAHPVVARLVVESTHAVPGKPIRVGVHLTQAKGWHTYWKSPSLDNATGLATEVEWVLPPGAKATAHAYPVPSQFAEEAGTTYGYNDQVMVFTEITLPEGQSAGKVKIGAKVSWLTCLVQCIPANGEVERIIKVIPGQAPAPSPSAPLFAHFSAQSPVPLDQVPGLKITHRFDPPIVPKDGKFTYSIVVSGEGMEVPAGTALWPTFTPSVLRNHWMLQNDKDFKAISPTLQGGGTSFTTVIKGMTFGSEDVTNVDPVGGLMMVKIGGKWVRTEISVPLPLDGSARAPAAPSQSAQAAAPSGAGGGAAQGGLLTMLFLAFLGGLILNVMPCVLPVLSLKIYGIVEQQNASVRERRMAGLAYAAGVVLSFMALAGVVIVARTSFNLNLGWGQQFQSPGFIIVLATIVFAFGLNLFGVFEVPAFGSTQLAKAQDKEGWLGHLLSGVFATVLSTPCSAPFLGTGIGFALTLPSVGLMGFFAVAGVGLALPFLLVAWIPGVARFLPRPGAWMDTFRQFLGFALMATTVWLLDALGGQVGREGVFGFLVFLTAVGFGCWILGRWASPIATTRSKLLAVVCAVAVSGVFGNSFLVFEASAADSSATTDVPARLDYSEKIPWYPFNDCLLENLEGRTVFVDFTADWCPTCKVTEKTVLATDTVRLAMEKHEVVPLIADFTRRDPKIKTWLDRFQRASVPMYMVVPADRSKAPFILPEVFQPETLVEALERG